MEKIVIKAAITTAAIGSMCLIPKIAQNLSIK